VKRLLVGCLDVHYADPRAAAACLVLPSWQASEPADCVVRKDIRLTIEEMLQHR
jgi:hypothetical protein